MSIFKEVKGPDALRLRFTESQHNKLPYKTFTAVLWNFELIIIDEDGLHRA